MTPVFNTTIGDRNLCAWQPVAGIAWVQTRDPKHNERLRHRKDRGRLVVTGVHGGYLRTYEFQHSLRWAAHLIARYTRNETRADGTTEGVNPGWDAPESSGRIPTAGTD